MCGGGIEDAFIETKVLGKKWQNNFYIEHIMLDRYELYQFQLMQSIVKNWKPFGKGMT